MHPRREQLGCGGRNEMASIVAQAHVRGSWRPPRAYVVGRGGVRSRTWCMARRESEVRQAFAVLPDGRLGQYKASTPDINAAVGRGQIKRDYSNIRVPVLVFMDYPWPPGDPLRPTTVIVDGREYQPVNDDERAAIVAYARVERRRVDQRTAT